VDVVGVGGTRALHMAYTATSSRNVLFLGVGCCVFGAMVPAVCKIKVALFRTSCKEKKSGIQFSCWDSPTSSRSVS
jgi:hypothetical protein